MNISTTRLGILIALIAFTVSHKQSFGMGMIPYEATEWTQLANNIELINITIQEAQQIANQLQALQNMINNSMNFPNQIWGNSMNQMVQLSSIVRTGQSLAYSVSNLDAVFQGKFKGYSHYQRNKMGVNGYRRQYKTWTDTIRATMKAANLQHQQFGQEEVVVKQLERMSETSKGRMQAIQTGNQIAVQEVRQLQKLRQLMMSQMQMQASFLASQNDRDSLNQAKIDEYYYSPNGTIIGDENRY
ncbi:MAG: P-type conjugative transfer protein TrbJ [Candidatus Margulisbacteria bacterium]|nr:P-type conjugative transfer protein TrbJ [Candidatus Margulisiibacteriota bacterium]